MTQFLYCAKASPWPEVKWLKDGVPVSKRVTISNTEGASQLLLPSAERSDTGVYTIMIKNIVGQESFSVEIRVTGQIINIYWNATPKKLNYIIRSRCVVAGGQCRFTLGCMSHAYMLTCLCLGVRAPKRVCVCVRACGFVHVLRACVSICVCV